MAAIRAITASTQLAAYKKSVGKEFHDVPTLANCFLLAHLVLRAFRSIAAALRDWVLYNNKFSQQAEILL